MALYYFIPSSLICPLLFLSLKFFKFPYPLTNNNFLLQYHLRVDPGNGPCQRKVLAEYTTTTNNNSLNQDSPASRLRDTFSGFRLSSSALQQPTHQPFSGSPSGALMTDPTREAREAGGYRAGLIFPLPRAARTDTWLEIDAAPPEAAAFSCTERLPTVLDIPETKPTGETRLPGPAQQRGSRSPRCQSRKRPRNHSPGVYWPKKRSPHRSH